MAINEIALVSLAWSLAVNPTDADVQKYQTLNQEDQITIQRLVEKKDALPFEIERLKEKSLREKFESISHAPTTETTT